MPVVGAGLCFLFVAWTRRFGFQCFGVSPLLAAAPCLFWAASGVPSYHTGRRADRQRHAWLLLPRFWSGVVSPIVASLLQC